MPRQHNIVRDFHGAIKHEIRGSRTVTTQNLVKHLLELFVKGG